MSACCQQFRQKTARTKLSALHLQPWAITGSERTRLFISLSSAPALSNDSSEQIDDHPHRLNYRASPVSHLHSNWSQRAVEVLGEPGRSTWITHLPPLDGTASE